MRAAVATKDAAALLQATQTRSVPCGAPLCASYVRLEAMVAWYYRWGESVLQTEAAYATVVALQMERQRV